MAGRTPKPGIIRNYINKRRIKKATALESRAKRLENAATQHRVRAIMEGVDPNSLKADAEIERIKAMSLREKAAGIHSRGVIALLKKAGILEVEANYLTRTVIDRKHYLLEKGINPKKLLEEAKEKSEKAKALRKKARK